MSIRNIFVSTAVWAMLTQSSFLIAARTKRSTDTCGVPNGTISLIVHGQSFPRGSFPWTVALMHTGTRPPTFFGAGTLISKTFVISAAHCILEKHATAKFLPRDILAQFGAHDLNDLYEPGMIQQSPVKIYIHDDWNHLTNSYDADVSLLQFEIGSITYSNYIRPICLWDSEHEPTVTVGIVTGWGKSEDQTKVHENKPKLITAPIQSNEDCFLDEGALLDLSSKRTFCAGLRNGSGVCQGDSGGGLFIKVNEIFYLKGIVSSSLIKDGGCDVSKNAIYTNVLKFRDWIRGITGIPAVNIAEKKMRCLFEKTLSFFHKRQLNTCRVNQGIESDDYVFESPINNSIEMFNASDNSQLKYFPRHIGQKLPNLKEFYARRSGLIALRDFYFKGMRNLQYLFLESNQIATIEAKAFDDLVNVRHLRLVNNMIETLDEKLFAKMVNLKEMYLNANKIKLLSPRTFKIPGNGKLWRVQLHGNVCIGADYGVTKKLTELESDIRANCHQ